MFEGYRYDWLMPVANMMCVEEALSSRCSETWKGVCSCCTELREIYEVDNMIAVVTVVSVMCSEDALSSRFLSLEGMLENLERYVLMLPERERKREEGREI